MKEEKFIIELIFYDNFDIKLYKSTNPEKIISILSRHLIIPLFYYKILQNNLLDKFPNDFILYISEISKINFNRNAKLHKEITLLSKILSKNKIPHIFLKGSGNILSKMYKKNYVRMVGDIDILIKKENCDKAFKLLNELDYYPISKISFQENHRHLQRLVNKKKMFPIEIHHKLFNNYKAFEKLNLFDNIILSNGYKTLNNKTNLIYNILNTQVNDSNSIFLKYSFRNIYDSFLINKKIKKEINNEVDTHLEKYKLICKNLNLNFLKYDTTSKLTLTRWRLYLIFNFKFYKLIDYLFLKFGLKFLKNLNRLYMILCYNSYREYIFKKYLKT